MPSMASSPTAHTDPVPLAEYPAHPPTHASTKSLLASTWQVLDQPPPPSLREILGAYRTRGDGDREMLMAMLNAKSAEDQRIASVASLHRSMLEYYQIPQPMSPPYDSYPPQLDVPASYNGAYHAPPTAKSSAPNHYREARPPSQSRKRHRASESPTHSYRSVPSTHMPSSPPHVPSSPYSSARSDSADRSPRSRDAMAIGSLLTAGARPREDVATLRNGAARDDRPHRSGNAHPSMSTSNPVSV